MIFRKNVIKYIMLILCILANSLNFFLSPAKETRELAVKLMHQTNISRS